MLLTITQLVGFLWSFVFASTCVSASFVFNYLITFHKCQNAVTLVNSIHECTDDSQGVWREGKITSGEHWAAPHGV